MDLQHTFTVPTSIDETWALFMDVERVGNCFPGAKVTEATGDGFAGTAKVKLGPIVLLYAGSGSFIERDASAYRAVLEAKGKDKRGNGTAGATVTIQLSPDGQGSRADVTTDLAITGKPAQFGRGVMQDVSDKLLEQFSACIERQLSPSAVAFTAMRPAEASSPQPSAQPTGEAGAANGVLGGSGRAQEPAVSAATPRTHGQYASDEAIDLGSAVLPVLVQRYAALALSAVSGLILGWLLGRRRARR